MGKKYKLSSIIYLVNSVNIKLLRHGIQKSEHCKLSWPFPYYSLHPASFDIEHHSSCCRPGTGACICLVDSQDWFRQNCHALGMNFSSLHYIAACLELVMSPIVTMCIWDTDYMGHQTKRFKFIATQAQQCRRVKGPSRT